MFDTKRFILCVKRYPCLWKTDDEVYKDKRLRAQAWQMIGREIYPDWQAVDAEGRLQRGKEMQKKWKNIRDRYIKDTRLGSSRRKAKKYPFFEMLDFLRTTISVRAQVSPWTRDALPDDTAINPGLHLRRRRTFRGCEDGRPESRETEEETVGFLAGEDAAKVTAIEIKREDIRESPVFAANTERQIHQANPSPFHDEEMDADKAFFYSLLPIVRKFNDAQKMDMRIEILNVIKDIQRR